MENEASKTKISPKKGFMYALLSGVLACIAGFFGKLFMREDETLWICETVCSSTLIFDFGIEDTSTICSQNFVVSLQAMSLLIMVLVNLLMWTTFLKALHFCHTSLEAMVTNSAANFFASALVGRLVLGESAGIMWWFGTLLILLGLCLMNYSEKGGTFKYGSIFRAKPKKHKSH